MSESDSESEGVSMLDVLNEEHRLEEQARLVLGDTDDSNCTYSLGYVKRQPLYSCLTCASSETGGVCLACSLHCHQGHDLVEMYTKRNFRCDCGNSRFGKNARCKLVPVKAGTNVDNRYDHNFRGLYCVCDRPYPDPDRDEEEEEDMLQCAVCEDWYHVSHLDVAVPSEGEGWELVCARCVEEHRFLKHYKDDRFERKEPDEEEGVCRMDLVERGKGKVTGGSQSVFLPDGWRGRLCRCGRCLAMYRQETVEYLLDPEDTLRWYQERGEAQGAVSSRYKMAMERLAGMDPVARAEVVEGYNEMQENLKEYLTKFAENGKVVRDEDIREFFDGLTKNKRRRLE